jgi:hypothetical protein
VLVTIYYNCINAVGSESMLYKMLVGKPDGKRQLGRPRRR